MWLNFRFMGTRRGRGQIWGCTCGGAACTPSNLGFLTANPREPNFNTLTNFKIPSFPMDPTPALLHNHTGGLVAVNELAEALTLGQGVDAVIETALNRVLVLLGADVGAIFLLDKDSMMLKLRASQGIFSSDVMHAITSPEGTQSFLRCLLETGHAIVIEDIRSAEKISTGFSWMLSRNGFVSWVCAPLKMEGEVIGAYHLGKRSPLSINLHDAALLEIIGNVVGSSLSNAQLLRDLRYKEAELRRALRRAVELQEDERKRLARELHDEVGQALTSILIRLKSLQEQEDDKELSARLDDLRSLTAQTIEELRRLAMDLRPAALDSLGIVPALRWYTQQSAERTGLAIHFSGPDQFERLPLETELILYRVAQEGLTNAIRHGKSQNIDVTLEKNETAIRLTISDNGKGFDAIAMDRGLGLVGIRERIELLNGSFNLKTAPGAGTQLIIEIPVKKKER
jgi:signal transduction histidine kinase